VIDKAVLFLRSLYRAYMESDGSLAEINPLAVTEDGRLLAADAKFQIDDNALFRHPEFEAFKEESEEDEIEAEAHRRGINYVRLGGDSGIRGKRPGLAMGRLDEQPRAGGGPADCRAVGAGAQADRGATPLGTALSD